MAIKRTHFIQFYTLVFFAFIRFIAESQTPTIGLKHYDPAVSDGYMLFSPQDTNEVYLVNVCGEKVNSWTFSEKPGLTCYLLENGTLLRAGIDSLEIRDWDNTLIWAYALTANGILQHHDIEPLPNGNILCVVSDLYTSSEIIAQGRDQAMLPGNFRMEKIIEIEPVGVNQANIVWEWKFIDHLVQDFDNTKPNFGVVADHPELLDINFNNGEVSDYIHLNSVDYNADLDQILISARHLSEIYIIDHSTTTVQAMSHVGGNSNKGGDFLWRWGNPQVYGQGTLADQKLYKQHDAKWVQNGFVDEGKISVFNNGGDGTGTNSSVHLLLPDLSTTEYGMSNAVFLPLNFDWTWQGQILGDQLLETKQSGCQSLANGNMMITQSNIGQIAEINKNGDLLWAYVSPISSIVYNQFDTFISGENSIFRGEKYSSVFIGFQGKDLTPQGIIENENTVSENCIQTLTLIDEKSENLTFVNPIHDGFLRFSENSEIVEIQIINLQGQIIFKNNHLENSVLYIGNLSAGNYLLQIQTVNDLFSKKVIIQ